MKQINVGIILFTYAPLIVRYEVVSTNPILHWECILGLVSSVFAGNRVDTTYFSCIEDAECSIEDS